MPLILASNSASGGYNVANSLRFNLGSADYLNRTLGTSTSRRIYTMSTWVKRSVIGTYAHMYAFGPNPGDFNYLRFNNSQQLNVGLNGDTYILTTNALYRDVSAWYHVVCAIDTTQATASNRVKLYVNGEQVTSFASASYPTQNFDTNFTNGITMRIGSSTWGTNEIIDGYLAETYIIDGQALTPSSFGQTDPSVPSSGIWQPKAYTGSYGTNGFYLKFANSAALGTDSSGNGNTFTVNNLTSVDQSTDTPTNNFATLNPLAKMSTLNSIQTLSEGNLKAVSSADWRYAYGSIPMSSGKWYVEVKITSSSGSNYVTIGLNPDNFSNGADTAHSYSTTGVWYNSNGEKWVASSNTAYGNSYTTNDIIGVAIDMTNSQVTFYKNGVAQNSGTPLNFNANLTGASSIIFGLDCYTATTEVNFGNPSYSSGSYTDGAGYGNFSYAVPSGYYSLCTKNLANFG